MLPHDDLGDGPAVVLLHAGVADRRMWADHLEPIAAAGYRAVAVDLPGFGDAPLPSDEELAHWDDVLETMAGLGIGSAALVGNSFGAAVALRVAAVAPERVSALALVSAFVEGIEISPELELAWEEEGEARERGDLDAAVEAVVSAWTLPDAPDEIREGIAAMQRRSFALQAEAEPENAPDPLVLDDPAAPDGESLDPHLLAAMTMPALIACGEHDMPDFRAGAEHLAAVLPNARLHVFAGAGHLVPLEQPDAFREVLLGFLQSGLR